MVPPSQCDVSNNLTPVRDRNKQSFKPLNRALKTKTSMTKPVHAGKLSFGEDFVLEHSCADLPVTLITVSTDSGSVRRDFQHSPQAYGFPC